MKDEHDALVRDWKQNARRNEDAAFRFLWSLKMVSDLETIDALASELHAEAFGKVDCTRCANCCKTMQPGLPDEDIGRIAGHLGLSWDAFAATFLETDSDQGGLRMKSMPCPFLGQDNRCTIYEVRPQAWREFSHTPSRRMTRSGDLVACVDGLTGFPEAIRAAYPRTRGLSCIVHLGRAVLKP